MLRFIVTFLALGFTLSAYGQQATTTLYVNRYFEVRDHEQPTKYVFDGATRVASVIGSLSTTSRLQRIRLYAGWNLCSLAVSGSLGIAGGQTPAEVISALFKWDAARAGWSVMKLDETPASGTVLWVQAKTNGTLTVSGSYADPTEKQLSTTGSTYLAVPGLEAWSPRFPSGFFSSLYEAPASNWHNHLDGGLSAFSDWPGILEPGQAFYAEAAAPASLDLPDQSLRIRYFHQDHLDSTSAITDARGDLVEEAAFYPFGASRVDYVPRQIHEPYQFTQKERDRESDLSYFEARYLAGACSRFISVDPKYANPDALGDGDLSAFLSTPQQMNVYAYVQNNPLRYTDPTGLDSRRARPARQSAPAATIATPFDGPGRTAVRQRNGNVLVTLKNGVQVTILPDTHDIAPGNDNSTRSAITESISRDGTGLKVTYTIKVRTHFVRGDNPDDDSAFGRGTTDDDEKAKHKSVRFHEGQHGARILDWLETHPLPEIEEPPQGSTWREMNNKRIEKMQKYNDDLEDYHVQETDCVGHKNLNATRACH